MHATGETTSTLVRQAYVTTLDPERAVAALREQLGPSDGAWITFFCSPDYDLARLGPAIQRGLPGAVVVGCTSAGHHGIGGYVHDGIVAASVRSDRLEAEVIRIDDLREITLEGAAIAARSLCQRMESRCGRPTSANSFVMLLSDALAAREEVLAMGLNMGLEGIRLFGGSAADEGRLEATCVYHDGAFLQNAAVATLVRTEHAFHIFKHAHFEPTETRMVVTRARPEARVVERINGRPAATEYARLLGIEVRPNDPMQFSHYPVMVRYGDEHFMRTPMDVDPAGPMRFACAIEEGVVLTTSRPRDLVQSLRESLEGIRAALGEPDLIVGCDCTGRLMEIEQKGLTEPVSRLLREANAVSFATYGEQLDSMHINQTLTGVAIRA